MSPISKVRDGKATRHDLNPNRYRDNLSILKYSLRSLERFAPWIRRVFLVTCRPQKPAWLDDRAVSRLELLGLVHSDADGQTLALTRRGRFLGGGVTADLLT